MAITPISNRYKGFIFAGENSRDYGVYITEPAVFGSPERDVDIVSVAGRNGDYIIDNGRYNNIEVVYNCALPAESDSDFIDGVSAFRNMLSSRIGYQRLTDEINADEYREGAFVAGLDVDTLNVEAGTFSVRFNCKPQRFLTAGETAVELNSGEEITNPTAYTSRPLLKVWGYGEISIGADTLQIISAPIGWSTVATAKTGETSITSNINADILNNGDEIIVNEVYFNMTAGYTGGLGIVDRTISKSASLAGYGTLLSHGASWYGYHIENESFYKGTPKTIAGNLTIKIDLADSSSVNIVFAVSFSYDGDNLFTASLNATTVPASCEVFGQTISLSVIRANSTQSALGSPLFFDLDIGEAYKIENGVVVSVNNAVTIPAVLPTLPEGATEVTFDNTITKFEIVPRWWLL